MRASGTPRRRRWLQPSWLRMGADGLSKIEYSVRGTYIIMSATRGAPSQVLWKPCSMKHTDENRIESGSRRSARSKHAANAAALRHTSMRRKCTKSYASKSVSRQRTQASAYSPVYPSGNGCATSATRRSPYQPRRSCSKRVAYVSTAMSHLHTPRSSMRLRASTWLAQARRWSAWASGMSRTREPPPPERNASPSSTTSPVRRGDIPWTFSLPWIFFFSRDTRVTESPE